VNSFDVYDATEGAAPGEKTSLLELGDPFNVVLTWELDGIDTTIAGGYWLVTLYSSNMDGTGAMVGQLAASPATPATAIAITGAASPLRFTYTFNVVPGSGGVVKSLGLYKLTATINHSPTASQGNVSEMFGFAESTPIQITQVVDDPD
jgi:hypothetical protein